MGHFLMKMAVVLVDVFMAFLLVWQKHLTDAAKRRKGLLGLRVCRVSQSQRVRCGSHRRQACIVISSGYIVSPMVMLYLQWLHCDLKWSHCVSSDHIVSLYSHIVFPVVTLYLQWSHCVSSSHIVSLVVTLCLQQSHCVSGGYIVSPAVTLCLQWLHYVSSGYIVSPVVTLCLRWLHCVSGHKAVTWKLMLNRLPSVLFIHLRIPVHGMMPSIFKAGLPSLWKLRHRLAQRCVS